MKGAHCSLLCVAVLVMLLLSSAVQAFPSFGFGKDADGNLNINIGGNSITIDQEKAAAEAKKIADAVHGVVQDVEEAVSKVDWDEVKAEHDAFVDAHRPIVEEVVANITAALKAADLALPAACTAEHMTVDPAASDAKSQAVANAKACLIALKAEGEKVRNVLAEHWRQHHVAVAAAAEDGLVGAEAAVVRSPLIQPRASAAATEHTASAVEHRPIILKDPRRQILPGMWRGMAAATDAQAPEVVADGARSPLIQPRAAAATEHTASAVEQRPIILKDPRHEILPGMWRGKAAATEKRDLDLHVLREEGEEGEFDDVAGEEDPFSRKGFVLAMPYHERTDVAKARDVEKEEGEGTLGTTTEVTTDFGPILTSGAVTGLVVILIFAGLLVLLVCVEAIPIAMDWLHGRRHPEESDDAVLKKKTQEEVNEA